MLLTALLLACNAGLADGTFATGSQSIVTAAAHDAVYVVDPDGGRLVRHGTDGSRSVVTVGSRPERVARVGNRLLVTLRGERAVAEVVDEDGALRLNGVAPVGAEPVGIVAREDGTRVYVALSLENVVVELDGDTLAERRRWAVDGQPQWLALHPTGATLFVASAMGGELYAVNLLHDRVESVELPAVTGAGDGGSERMSRRFTGDPAISPDGKQLAVPGLLVDNLSEVDAADADSSGGYASEGTGVSRFNPAVFVAPLGAEGQVAGSVAAVLVAGESPVGSRREVVRSYPSSVSYAPLGDVMVVTMEASKSAVVLSTMVASSNPDVEFESFDSDGVGSAFSEGMASTGGVFVSMDAGPRGVAFLDDERALVHNFLSRSLREVNVTEARTRVAQVMAGTSFELSTTLEGGEALEVYDSALTPDAEAGRLLFYSAVNDLVAVDASGVSCSTCHFQGRNDGLTWNLSGEGSRQTPSLALSAASTAPYTWTGAVRSITSEAMLTSQGRMGGEGLDTATAEQIAAFVATIPLPLVAHAPRDEAAVKRGAELFARADVGCAGCHPAPLYTDNLAHPMYGLAAVNTPSLLGLATTAPYLHDGSAPTLAAVLATARGGAMGDVSMLGDEEIADLEAFLGSL